MTEINEDTFSDLLKTKALIDQIGPDAFVKSIAPNRSEIESILLSRTEVERAELISMIKNHLSVMNNYYHTADTSLLNVKEEQLINLVVSAFTVGYTMGVGKQAMAALPILALAGANIEIGKEVVTEFIGVIKKPADSV